MARLDNKIAIVTGGAGGIGSGIVRAYVKENAKVVIADIAEEKGRTLSTELNKQGYETLFIKTDLSNKESLKSCVDQTIQTYGQIDILINNAHASRMNNFLDITEEDLDLSFNTGFYATFYLCQMVIPHLKETQGNIINFGSGAAVKGDKNQGSYVVAKEAIRGITRVIANEFGEFGINANVISLLLILKVLINGEKITQNIITKLSKVFHYKNLETLKRHWTGRCISKK